MPHRGNRIRVGRQFQAVIPPMAGGGDGGAGGGGGGGGGADPMPGGKRKGYVLYAMLCIYEM